MTFEELRNLSTEAVVVADQRGNITEVNSAFETLFGWPRGELIGRPLTTIIPPDLRDAHNLGFSRFLMTREPTVINHPIRIQALKKSGEIFEAEHLILGEKHDGAWTFAARIKSL